MAHFPNYNFREFSKFDIFGIKIFFLIWKIIKIPKISKFWNFFPIWYSALFAIFSIFISFFDISFIFYYSDSRKFVHSAFARSLIFKFEISAILQFYCSKFWPSPKYWIIITVYCNSVISSKPLCYISLFSQGLFFSYLIFLNLIILIIFLTRENAKIAKNNKIQQRNEK